MTIYPNDKFHSLVDASNGTLPETKSIREQGKNRFKKNLGKRGPVRCSNGELLPLWGDGRIKLKAI